MRFIESIGILLLGTFVIARGVLTLFAIPIANFDTYLQVLAIAAGILLLFRLQDPKAYLNVGMLLLCLWLILGGVLPLLNIDFPGSGVVLSIIAVGSGLFFLPSIRSRTFYNLGLFFLGLWLIASQALPYLGVNMPFYVGLGLLAALAAILLLLGM